MSSRIFETAFTGGIGITATALVLGACIHPERRTAAWMMVTGAIFMLIGVGGLVWILLDPPYFRTSSWSDELRIALPYGSFTIAVVLFSIGFLWDQIKRRRHGKRLNSSGTSRLSGPTCSGEVQGRD